VEFLVVKCLIEDKLVLHGFLKHIIVHVDQYIVVVVVIVVDIEFFVENSILVVVEIVVD
jgi:hypothetical protein